MKITPYLLLCCFFCILCTPPAKVTDGPALPEHREIRLPFIPVPSIINVPIEIQTTALEQIINEQLPELIYATDTLSLGKMENIRVKVWKGDSIHLSLTGDELQYGIPVKIWMQFSFTVGALGLSHTEYQEVEAGIILRFSTRLVIKNDWEVVTMTKSLGYEWTTDPVVKVRFITIPVKSVADFILSRNYKQFGELVDKGIQSSLDIKKLLQPTWEYIQKPVRLSEYPPLWLKLTPQAVSMTQIEGNGRLIKCSVGITSIAETNFGGEPKVAFRDSIPSLSVPGTIDSSFILNLYAEINYENASDLMKTYLLGRSFRSGRKEVIIQDVALYGMEGYVIVSLDFTGSFKGKVYVIGKAVYDSSSATISIEDLEFDVSTRNTLHNTADWLFHGVILEKVQPYLRFPLREKILESQLMVQKMLCNSRISQNVFVNGYIDSLSIGGVRITDSALQAVVLAKGSLNLTIRQH